MSALEVVTGEDGKCTQGGDQPSVGDATRALTLPHLPYADAIHRALTSAGLLPDQVIAGRRVGGADYHQGPRELVIRLEWWPGHKDLVAGHRKTAGIALEWSHLAGWSLELGADVVHLDVDDIAAPEVLAEAVLEAAVEDDPATWTPPPDAPRWQYALELDIALVHYAERGPQ